MEHLKHDWVSEIIAEIDAELERPPIDIETALGQAVYNGSMTAEEAYLCMAAYERSLAGIPHPG